MSTSFGCEGKGRYGSFKAVKRGCKKPRFVGFLEKPKTT